MIGDVKSSLWVWYWPSLSPKRKYKMKPLFAYLTRYSTKSRLVLSLAAIALTSWATFTGYTARLDKVKNPTGLANVATRTKATERTNINTNYGKLPLSFEANRGQTDASVKYLARGGGYNIFLTGAEAALVFQN